MEEHTHIRMEVIAEAEAPSSSGARLARIADAVARWSVALAVLLIPLAYLPWTANGLEFTKQAALIILAIAATLGWLGRMLVMRAVEWRKTPMNLLVGTYLIVYFLSAWFSENRYVSFVGDFGQEGFGAVTVACFALLYLVAVNSYKNARDIWKLLSLSLLSGLVVLILGYLQAFGVRFLPGAAAESSAFNLIGTSNALGVYAGFLLALLMGFFLAPDQEPKWRLVRQVLMGVLGVLALFYIAALSFWVIWLVVVAAAILILAYGMVKTDKVVKVTMLAVPMALIVVGILFMFLRFPVSFGLPAEVMPSLRASFNISKDALSASPLLGTGPGTFLFDYTRYKAQTLNDTAFWNVHFDRSSSGILTLLATTGILGIAAWLVLFGYLAGRAAMGLARGREDWLLRLTVFSGFAALLVGRLLYSTNLSLEFLFWLMATLLVMLEWREFRRVEFERSPRSALLLSFFFIVAVIFSIAGLYLEGQRYAAEASYTRAATMKIESEADVDQAIERLARAVRLNGQNDLYYRILSQALRLKVNLELQKITGQPTAEQTRLITVLTADAVNTGKLATDLNPKNVQNWASLAGMYRDLIGVAEGAREAAETAYETAIALEPANPIYHTELGKIRLGLSEEVAARAGAGEEDRAAAERQAEELLLKAAEAFQKAVDLKGDYAPAHYWLAIAWQRQGKTAEALERMAALRAAAPEDLGVGLQYALLKYQSGDKTEAVTELERLIKLSPTYANARWFLSAMYEEEGRKEEALAQVEEIAKFDPENPNVKARLEALRGTPPPPPPEGLPEPIETAPEGEVIQAP